MKQSFQKSTDSPSTLDSSSLRNSINQFLEQISDFAYMADKDGNVVYVNSASEAYTGIPVANFIGQPLVSIIEEENRELFTSKFRLALHGNQQEYAINLLNNRKVLFSSNPYNDENGSIVAVIGTAKDISDTATAEVKLNQDARRLKDTLHSMNGWIWEVDHEGLYIYASEKIKEILGYEVEEIIGKTPFDLVEPESAAKIEAAFKEVTARKDPIKNLENWNLHKNGNKVCFLTNGLPILDNGGNLKGYRGVDIDITKRKEMEFALNETRDRFRQVTEQSPSVYELYDIDGLQIEVNKAYEDLWQFPEGRARTVGTFNVLQSKEVVDTGLITFIRQAYDGEIVTLPPYEFDPSGETEAKGVGRKRWLNSKIYPLKDRNNKVTNIVITHEDISDRVYAEQEQEKLRAQLLQSQKMDAVGHLAGGVAHDFNNIMHGVYSSAHLLERKIDAGKSTITHQKKWLGTIKDLSKRGGELTQNLLNFAGQAQFTPLVINPNFVIREVVKFLSIGFKPTGHIIKTGLHSKQNIYADAIQIHQIIQNILINGKDAMQAGGNIKVESADVSLENDIICDFDTIPAGDYVQLSIHDAGSGMSNDVARQIFNPFFTTKEKGKGTGLGLSVTYQILKSHRAYCDIETELGSGTTFKLYFKGIKDDLADESIPQHDFVGTEKILVVDDEEVIREGMKSNLEQMNYTVITAEEGKEALRKCESEVPDVILSDLIMSEGMGGQILYETIRKKHPGIPFYCMTGYYEQSEVKDLKEMGVKEVFQKPFSVYDFLKRLREDMDKT